MKPEDIERWADHLTPEQRQQLDWLITHRCNIEATWAPADPLHDLPPGVVLEVLVNKHAVVKIRGTELSGMFDYIYKAARNLFDFVEQENPGWQGVRPSAEDDAGGTAAPNTPTAPNTKAKPSEN